MATFITQEGLDNFHGVQLQLTESGPTQVGVAEGFELLISSLAVYQSTFIRSDRIPLANAVVPAATTKTQGIGTTISRFMLLSRPKLESGDGGVP